MRSAATLLWMRTDANILPSEGREGPHLREIWGELEELRDILRPSRDHETDWVQSSGQERHLRRPFVKERM